MDWEPLITHNGTVLLICLQGENVERERGVNFWMNFGVLGDFFGWILGFLRQGFFAACYNLQREIFVKRPLDFNATLKGHTMICVLTKTSSVWLKGETLTMAWSNEFKSHLAKGGHTNSMVEHIRLNVKPPDMDYIKGIVI